MFTATWPKEVISLAKEFLTNPINITMGQGNSLDQQCLKANKNVIQKIQVIEEKDKQDSLIEIFTT